MKKVVLFLFLVINGSIQAQSPAPISIPEVVTGEPGDFITLKATTVGTDVKWYVIDKGLKQFPSEFLNDKKITVVVAMVPGTYRVLAWTAIANKPTDAVQCIVKINGTPPTPGPSPGPTPTPTPPVPDTPLITSLKQAWAKETTEDKTKLSQLIELFKTGAIYAKDPRITTGKDINDLMKAAREKTIGNALPNVRQIMNTELQKTFNDPGPLTDTTRNLLADTFNRIANSLSFVQSARKL